MAWDTSYPYPIAAKLNQYVSAINERRAACGIAGAVTSISAGWNCQHGHKLVTLGSDWAVENTLNVWELQSWVEQLATYFINPISYSGVTTEPDSFTAFYSEQAASDNDLWGTYGNGNSTFWDRFEDAYGYRGWRAKKETSPGTLEENFSYRRIRTGDVIQGDWLWEDLRRALNLLKHRKDYYSWWIDEPEEEINGYYQGALVPPMFTQSEAIAEILSNYAGGMSIAPNPAAHKWTYLSEAGGYYGGQAESVGYHARIDPVYLPTSQTVDIDFYIRCTAYGDAWATFGENIIEDQFSPWLSVTEHAEEDIITSQMFAAHSLDAGDFGSANVTRGFVQDDWENYNTFAILKYTFIYA